MRKYLFALLVLVAAGTTLLVAAFAVAGSGSHNISAQDGLTGYQEVPAISSTTGNGSFEAKVANDDSSFDWTLSYGDLEGSVTQAHIHFGGRRLSGGISIWLCGTASQSGPGRDARLARRRRRNVSGTADAADVVGPRRSGDRLPEQFDEILAAIRAGKAYANVHSTKYGPAARSAAS